MREMNIKEGMPTVAEARKRLQDELAVARRLGAPAVKIVHGYGSNGTGGALRVAIRQTLAQRQREGKIRTYVPGERWGIFDPEGRTALEQ